MRFHFGTTMRFHLHTSMRFHFGTTMRFHFGSTMSLCIGWVSIKSEVFHRRFPSCRDLIWFSCSEPPPDIFSTCGECLWNFMWAEGPFRFYVSNFGEQFALPFWYRYTFPILRGHMAQQGLWNYLKLYDWYVFCSMNSQQSLPLPLTNIQIKST